MFGIGFSEVLVILVVALLVIGPDKLPEVAKTLAKAYNEFRRATFDIKKSVRDMDLTGPVNQVKEAVVDAATMEPEPEPEPEEAVEVKKPSKAKKSAPKRRRKKKQVD